VSLVASSVGASTITIPYIISISGILGGVFWIVAGAAMTFYAGRLLIICGEITGKGGYERLAKHSFGKRWKMIVGITQLVSLIGFVVSYLTLVRV
jgi:amino acid permease